MEKELTPSDELKQKDALAQEKENILRKALIEIIDHIKGRSIGGVNIADIIGIAQEALITTE